MPRQTGLLEINGRYYFNLRVPKELRQEYGKSLIREALKTADYKTAVADVRFRLASQEAEFAAKRRALHESRPPITGQVIPQLSQAELHALASSWFVELEKESEAEFAAHGNDLDESHREDIESNLRHEEVVLTGGSQHYAPLDLEPAVRKYLASKRIKVPEDSAQFQMLVELFRKARHENTQRDLARLAKRQLVPGEAIFRDTFAHTVVQMPSPAVTLGQVLTEYRKWLKIRNRVEGTVRTYETPMRLLSELIGDSTRLNELPVGWAEDLVKQLTQVPRNAEQRYRGIPYKKAIVLENRKSNPQRLAGKTLENYLTNISAIFKFAVEERGFLPKNPFQSKGIKQIIVLDEEKEEKAQFTPTELTVLFSAPLYTGCRDDERGYSESGTARPRRGRFWCPLLAFFHGFRANEVAQLYTEDVKTEEGIHYIHIREKREDGTLCDKRLKTSQSARKVPIHSELLKIGFLEFVEARRADSESPRLFPELEKGQTGYFSDPFSKWFGRFVETAISRDCKATFHSFRHQFRDALRNGGVHGEIVDHLGGWKEDKRNASAGYGRGPSLQTLQQNLEKAQFPSVDFSHLYPPIRKRTR